MGDLYGDWEHLVRETVRKLEESTRVVEDCPRNSVRDAQSFRTEGTLQSIWTDELISDLRLLWNKGHSASLIGKTLGISKNQVIGKVHRLKLPPRQSPIKANGIKELA